MPEFTGNISGNGVINFRSYIDSTDVPDLFNVGLRKVTQVYAVLVVNVLSYDSTLVWKGEGNPDRFRFGRITPSYFGAYEQEVFLNHLTQIVVRGAIYLSSPLMEATPNPPDGWNFSLASASPLRTDAVSYELAPSVQAQFVLRTLRSAELSGVWGYA